MGEDVLAEEAHGPALGRVEGPAQPVGEGAHGQPGNGGQARPQQQRAV